ncbi:thioredoxin family protein [Novacetimonas hansenii]|uniref:thioredoxin family protein n=1 Tax=Novacetimonas hansenii TaxID=436 RepID=UPI000791ADC0|nr:thioredoxin family protein [Novacetimonas hansenii]PYD72238.1 thioredoxin family protein [Novacetimonas hansenii]WEQ59019.1 thioredoxin family protein [Novacetimonas hansenii]CUW47471.1 Thiol:disulfide interchange protein DsbD [Novacetimonas hansenii]
MNERFGHMSRLWRAGLVAGACVGAIAGGAQAATVEAPPQIGNLTPTVPAQPYGPTEGTRERIATAFDTARATGRKVLLDFGGNWCPDCRILAGLMDDPAVAPWIARRFVVVMINVERMNTNLEFLEQHGLKISAVPTVLVVTAQGKVLNADGLTALGNARAMSSQAVIDLLAQWDART